MKPDRLTPDQILASLEEQLATSSPEQTDARVAEVLGVQPGAYFTYRLVAEAIERYTDRTATAEVHAIPTEPGAEGRLQRASHLAVTVARTALDVHAAARQEGQESTAALARHLVSTSLMLRHVLQQLDRDHAVEVDGVRQMADRDGCREARIDGR